MTVKKVLGDIVSRKYLVQQALAAKLDREPTVHLDLMRAREQVLAGAIMRRSTVANAGSIGKAEIDKYMSAHPQRFAKREIINVEQITFPVPTNVQSVVDAAKDFKTLDEVDQKLTQLEVPHNRSKGTLDSGELADDFFAALQAKKADDIFLIRTAANGTFFKSGRRTGDAADDADRPSEGGKQSGRDGGQRKCQIRRRVRKDHE